MATVKARVADSDPLRARIARLGLHGLASRWEELAGEGWIEELVEIEEEERARRSLERRVRNARIGRFRPICDFDWSWPKKVDRELVEELFRLDFLAEAANVVLIGPNGVGKTTIAQNLAHEALIQGYTVRMAPASAMLAELSSQDGPASLERRLRRYLRPSLLVIDSCGAPGYVEWSRRIRPGGRFHGDNTSHNWDRRAAQSASSHSRMDASRRQAARLVGMAVRGRALARAARFISRSTATYRFVVSTLAWPSQWLIVTRSTPAWRR